LVLQASGGVSRAEVVKPANTLHSGPVGGLAGVEFWKKVYGFENAMAQMLVEPVLILRYRASTALSI
jgi:N-methylhydantoinase A/oxoprolinase/acetone carboxylase beta subunit